MNLRLDKMISGQTGYSRKEAGARIRNGLVRVNGRPALRPEQKINPRQDSVEMEGQAIEYKEYLYIILHKPKGVISASNDSKQETAINLLPPAFRRKGLFPAGRLDKDTTGLLLITDDGAFAHEILSPKKRIFKVYCARLDGPVGEEERRAFADGIVLADHTECLPAKLILPQDDEGHIRVAVCEGKYHQVKRMFEAVGRRVLDLHRESVGGLTLDGALKPGQAREMTEEEKFSVFQTPENGDL